MTTLDVRERGRIEVDDEIVAATPPRFWKDADCTVTRGAGEMAWTLTAGDSVGVTRTITPIGDVTLRVRPKLDTADPFFLADYAYEQRQDPLRLLQDDVALEALHRDPSACLLAWHARSIHRFAARWLRRDYRTVDRALRGKVKGRILVSRYVSSHLAVGDAGTVPCRLQERTQDTANNRVLKAALRFIVSASHSLEVPAARQVVLREAKAALPLFANVSDIRVSTRAIRATSSRGPQRHYESVLAASTSLLQGQLLGDQLGSGVSTTSFMWQMPVLFQEAVRGILDSSTEVKVVSREVGQTLVVDADRKQRARSHADPDLVLDVGGVTVLVDTKYKDAMPSSPNDGDMLTVVADRTRVRVSRDDIYQVVAYRQHDKWPGSISILLYPVVLRVGDELPQPLRVLGFGEPVWILFIDVGRGAHQSLPHFLRTLVGIAPQNSSPTEWGEVLDAQYLTRDRATAGFLEDSGLLEDVARDPSIPAPTRLVRMLVGQQAGEGYGAWVDWLKMSVLSNLELADMARRGLRDEYELALEEYLSTLVSGSEAAQDCRMGIGGKRYFADLFASNEIFRGLTLEYLSLTFGQVRE